MDFLCECDDLQCQELVTLSRAEYETARTDPTHFLVRPDHVDERIEHVVRTTDRFAIVEKEGTAAAEAEADAD
jgi:5-bromo-4-chloroindolyl phosphate hydrolysis protein